MATTRISLLEAFVELTDPRHAHLPHQLEEWVLAPSVPSSAGRSPPGGGGGADDRQQHHHRVACRGPLKASPPEQRADVKPAEREKKTAPIEQIEKLEKEMSQVQEKYLEAESSYGSDLPNLGEPRATSPSCWPTRPSKATSTATSPRY